MDIHNILKLIKENEIETIDLKFSNLFGGIHHLTIPAQNLNPNIFTQGIGIDGSNIPGLKFKSGSSDAVIIPDPDALFIDPFWDSPTLSFLCSVYSVQDRQPYPLDPRQVAMKAERFLEKTGFADTSLWGPELEFYIFDSMKFFNETNFAGYFIGSSEKTWDNSIEQGVGIPYPIAYKRGYHAAPPEDKHYNLRNYICNHLLSFGIPIKYHHHEVGAPGQAEIETMLAPLVRSGDNSVLIKYASKMEAAEHGCCVTFMPKPLFNEAGSGQHFHQQLFKNDKPVFYDEKGYAGLSQTALHYIGGLLTHGAALLALTNPSTNSYKRLVPGFEAPVKAIFGLGNRSAAVRIPHYADQPDKKRIEFRPPDATCNPYIAMAAQLMAGIDGIKNKIDPVKAGFGPFDTDITKLSQEDRDAILSLPSSLDEALDALKNDHQFLLEGDVFCEELIENWIEWKVEKELTQVRNRPHPYEIELYFNV